MKSCLLAIIIACFLLNAASADQGIDNHSVRDLGVLLITPKRFLSASDKIAENVIFLSRQDIHRRPSNMNLSDVLTSVPGVDTQFNGFFGQSSALSINGSPSRQVLTMVDGIPFNTQLSGQADPAMIAVDSVKQVEIVKGASSNVWGSALGGAVNVITSDTGKSIKPQVRFKSSFAEHSTTKNSLEVSGKASRLGYLMSGSYFNTDGHMSKSDSEITQTLSKLSYDFNDENDVGAQFGYGGSDSFWGVTAINTLSQQTQNVRYGKVAAHLNKEAVPINLEYKYNQQDIAIHYINPATMASYTPTVSSNLFQGISLGSSYEVMDNHIIALGADFNWTTFKNNIYLSKAKSVSEQAVYINDTYTLSNWDFIPSMRFDENQHFGHQLSPAFGAVYHFHDTHQTKWRAKVSRAFSAPPLMWVYNQSPSVVAPNPDLKAEKAFVYETGLSGLVIPTLDYDISYYRSDINEGLAYDDASLRYENHKKIIRQGSELRLNYNPIKILTFYGSGGINDSYDASTKLTLRDDQGMARQKFTFGTDLHCLNGFGIHVAGYYSRWSAPGSSHANDRKPIVDTKISQQFKDFYKHYDGEMFFNT